MSWASKYDCIYFTYLYYIFIYIQLYSSSDNGSNWWKNKQRKIINIYATLAIKCTKTLLYNLFFLAKTSLHYTALHVVQKGYSDENSVRPYVRLSVCHTRELWQNRRKIWPDFYTIRKIIRPSLLRRRMVCGGDPFYLKFWVNCGPRWSKIADFEPIIAQSINQSINQFISRHSTEARATVRLCRIKEKCLEMDLKCVNGWSSSTVQWKRVSKSRSSNGKTTSSSVQVVR